MTTEPKHSGNVVRADFGKGSRPEAAGASATRAAFVENLYKQNFAELCRTLRRVYGEGPPEPEDLAQQAFEKITSLDSHAHIENPRAFLFKVAINLGLKSIRRIKLARAYVGEQLNHPENSLEEIDPSRVYQGREVIRALDGAMDQLSVKQREIVIRSRFHGHTYAEISRTTGWSEADISRQLNAALKTLMQAVDHPASQSAELSRKADPEGKENG